MQIKIEFKDLKELQKILRMNKTDFADHFYNTMKDKIKIVGNDQDVYFYDQELKLWISKTREVYNAFVCDYLNDTGKAMFKFYKKLEADSEDDIDDEMMKLKADINLMRKHFDSSEYISAIQKRSTGKFQNNEFVTTLNMKHDFLPIQNGKKVNLITGEIDDRKEDDYFTFECPVNIVDNTEIADKFFTQIMPNDEHREYLRLILGYLLTGNMDARKFFVWYGDGSNGKSVIMKLMDKILGRLYHQCGKGIFMKVGNETAEGASPDKVALIGVRAGFYSEGETADNIDLNESFLKMVSGKDKINARALFRAPLTFYPVCKLNLATNYKPDVNGDKSIKERIIYIFFDSSFVDNPNPKRKNEFLKDDDFVDSLFEQHLSQIFSWILKGSIQYYKTKTIVPPSEFAERTNKIFSLQDSITSFFENRLELTNNDKDYMKRGELFE
jgi:P4 family phage/plasmid primase-like protien